MLSFCEYLFLEMPMQTGTNLALLQQGHALSVLFQNNAKLQSLLKKQEMEGLEANFFGVLQVRDNTIFDADEVDAVWAKPGYGPLMYLIGLQTAGKHGLMASRVKSQVTPAAKEIWRQFYQEAGQGFVQPIPLNSEHHEEPWLKCKYILKKPYNISGFLQKGKMALKNDPFGQKMDLLMEAADGLLRQQMNNIYNDD